MSKNIIRTVTVAITAAAGLAIGAGYAAAAPSDPPVPDGGYTLDVYAPVPGMPALVAGSVPVTVSDGALRVDGVVVPGVELYGVDGDDDGIAEGAVVEAGGSTWGQLR